MPYRSSPGSSKPLIWRGRSPLAFFLSIVASSASCVAVLAIQIDASPTVPFLVALAAWSGVVAALTFRLRVSISERLVGIRSRTTEQEYPVADVFTERHQLVDHDGRVLDIRVAGRLVLRLWEAKEGRRGIDTLERALRSVTNSSR